MASAEFLKKMKTIFHEKGYDEEKAHSSADRLMCQLLRQLGYEEGVVVFEHAKKWYS